MGTWGTGPFEDDTALDWVVELEGTRTDDVLVDALSAAADVPPDEYLESTEGVIAMAAAAIVACARDGLETSDLPDEARAYLARRSAPPNPRLVRLALAAIDRVMAPESELVALWEEPTDPTDRVAWFHWVETLRARLAS